MDFKDKIKQRKWRKCRVFLEEDERVEGRKKALCCFVLGNGWKSEKWNFFNQGALEVGMGQVN